MSGKKRCDKSSESTESRRNELLAKWAAKNKSELPMPSDEAESWLSKLEACLKVPAAKPTA